MILNEFIKETHKNQMISILLKHYGVGSVKVKQKPMKDHAHFNVDTGTLQLSTRYKTIKKRQVEDFLITIIHETSPFLNGWLKGDKWKKVLSYIPFKSNKNDTK